MDYLYFCSMMSTLCSSAHKETFMGKTINLNKRIMKQNIGQKVALYPTPATVVGTIDAEGKINFIAFCLCHYSASIKAFFHKI